MRPSNIETSSLWRIECAVYEEGAPERERTFRAAAFVIPAVIFADVDPNPWEYSGWFRSRTMSKFVKERCGECRNSECCMVLLEKRN